MRPRWSEPNWACLPVQAGRLGRSPDIADSGSARAGRAVRVTRRRHGLMRHRARGQPRQEPAIQDARRARYSPAIFGHALACSVRRVCGVSAAGNGEIENSRRQIASAFGASHSAWCPPSLRGLRTPRPPPALLSQFRRVARTRTSLRRRFSGRVHPRCAPGRVHCAVGRPSRRQKLYVGRCGHPSGESSHSSCLP